MPWQWLSTTGTWVRSTDCILLRSTRGKSSRSGRESDSLGTGDRTRSLRQNSFLDDKFRPGRVGLLARLSRPPRASAPPRTLRTTGLSAASPCSTRGRCQGGREDSDRPDHRTYHAAPPFSSGFRLQASVCRWLAELMRTYEPARWYASPPGLAFSRRFLKPDAFLVEHRGRGSHLLGWKLSGYIGLRPRHGHVGAHERLAERLYEGMIFFQCIQCLVRGCGERQDTPGGALLVAERGRVHHRRFPWVEAAIHTVHTGGQYRGEGQVRIRRDVDRFELDVGGRRLPASHWRC